MCNFTPHVPGSAHVPLVLHVLQSPPEPYPEGTAPCLDIFLPLQKHTHISISSTTKQSEKTALAIAPPILVYSLQDYHKAILGEVGQRTVVVCLGEQIAPITLQLLDSLEEHEEWFLLPPLHNGHILFSLKCLRFRSMFVMIT